MLILVFNFFFRIKASTERFFFSTTLVVLYRGNTKECYNKSFGFNPSTAEPKHIGRTAYSGFNPRLREISRMSS